MDDHPETVKSCSRLGRAFVSLWWQIHLNAAADRLRERPLRMHHRRIGCRAQADRQDPLPPRRMHIGTKPGAVLRRGDGYFEPAQTTRRLLDHRVTGTKRKL